MIFQQNTPHGNSCIFLSHLQQKLKCIFKLFIDKLILYKVVNFCNFICGIWVSTFQYELWNFVHCILYFTGKTSRYLMMYKFSFSESLIGLCKIIKAVANGKYLLVNDFPFVDKAFFSRLVYYSTCRLLGPFYVMRHSTWTRTIGFHHKLLFYKFLVHLRVF